MKIWLIGAGEMAQDSCNVVVAQDMTFEVIRHGRNMGNIVPNRHE